MSHSSLLAAATEKWLAAARSGSPLDVDQLASEYPEISSVLVDLLPALELMRDMEGSKQTRVPSTVPHVPGATSNDPTQDARFLGDYQLVREIGRGGMGVVYEAKQHPLGRRVAVKMLPFVAAVNDNRLRRFRLESQAAATVDHPNIVEVYDVGHDDAVHFFAMRYVEGIDVASLIRRLHGRKESHECLSVLGLDTTSDTLTNTIANDAMNVPEISTGDDEKSVVALFRNLDRRKRRRLIAQSMLQIADALQHAHEQGIIHRDIKPANIMVDTAGKPWVTDFGLAHVQTDQNLTMTGDFLGTLRYSAPEQLSTGNVIDHRADVYAWGVTLYEWMTLQPLVQGGSRQEILTKLIDRSRHRGNSTLVTDLPRDLETIIEKSIQINPSDRYQTAAAAAKDLRAWLDGRPITARPIGPMMRSIRWCQRNPWVTGFIASLLLGIFASSIFLNRAVQAQRLADQRAAQSEDTMNVLVEEVFAFADPNKKFDESITLRQILDQTYQRVANNPDYDPVTRINILLELGRVFFNIESYDQAEQAFAKALQLSTDERGDFDPLTTTAMDQLGMTYIRVQKHDLAKPLLTRAYEIQTQTLGPEHEDTIHSFAKLGDLESAMENYEESLRIARIVLEIRNRNWGNDYRFSLITHNGIGINYLRLNQPEKAKYHFRYALEQAENHDYGFDPIYYEGNLGLAHYLAGEYETGLEIFRRNTSKRVEASGEDSPFAWFGRQQIAIGLRHTGDLDGALEIYEACEGNPSAVPSSSIKKAIFDGEFGMALYQAKRFDEAIPKLKRCRQVMSKSKRQDLSLLEEVTAALGEETQ
ncbi:MAG: protein kinase [Planctomycetota bacterium]